MQTVIWCVICGIITAGSLCAALERLALVRRMKELETELAKKQKVLDYIADAEKEDAV